MARDLLLSESLWSADRSTPLLELTLGEMLRRLAQEVPQRVALVEAGADPGARRRWTYAELYASAQTVARSLLASYAPGERVAVWAPNCGEWLALQHGAAMAGLVLVTVNPAYLIEELHHVLSTSRAAGLFHADSYRGRDLGEAVAQLRDRLPQLRSVVPLSRWREFVAGGDPARALPAVQPGDMIQIQFTSGTTGKPKGACLHHRGLINAARFAAQRAGFPEGGVWATAMPLFHIGGCAASQFGAMSARGTLVLQSAFDAGAMLELIESERVVHLHAVPTMVVSLLEHPDLPRRDLSSLRTLMSGGSPVPGSLVASARERLGCRFTITFGQTELNGVICQTSPEDRSELQTDTIGRPAPQVELKIADPETGAVKPLDEPGEVWARGYQVMLGYFDAVGEAENAITADGWRRTGDLASMDAHGYLRITGRLKDTIIRGGENIYPREVEDALSAHPAVAQASVVGVPDARWGEVVAAVVRCHPGAARPRAGELFAHCRERLAAYKTPVLWFYVDQYPSTASGKIQKFALREMIGDGRLVAEPFAKPGAAVSTVDAAAEAAVEAQIAELGARYRIEGSLERLLSDRLRRRARGDAAFGGSSVADARSRLEAFLRENVAGQFAVEEVKRMSGGGSNASYSFTLRRGGQPEHLVLRVKQPGAVESYVPREFQMLRAVHGAFPVPKPYWVAEDERHFGAPALICGFVPGVQAPPTDAVMATGMGTVYGEVLRAKLGPQFVRYEAELHSYDWSGCDLGHFDIPRPGTTDAIDWRLALWDRTWDEDKFEEHPTMLLAKEWLWENRPVVDHVSILHGDYRNGNFLFDPDTGQITGILDWELCSLGDRHCDLGYTMLSAWGFIGPEGKFLNSALLDTETFVREYERISGLTVDPVRLNYYLIFNTYWSAVALYGTAIRNAEAGLTQLDVMYNVIAGKGGFDIGELNRLVVKQASRRP